MVQIAITIFQEKEIYLPALIRPFLRVYVINPELSELSHKLSSPALPAPNSLTAELVEGKRAGRYILFAHAIGPSIYFMLVVKTVFQKKKKSNNYQSSTNIVPQLCLHSAASCLGFPDSS